MADALDLPPGPGTDPAPFVGEPSRPATVLDISNAIVRLMKEHYGKGPTSVKTHLLGDTVVVLSKGGFTQVEHTLHDLGHGQAVIDQRQVFQQAMSVRLRAAVTDATGREVIAVMSAAHIDPDLSCDTFVLGAPAA